MSLFWALFIILVTLTLLFVIFPNILQNERQIPYQPVHTVSSVSAPLISLNELEQRESKELLESHYENAKPEVPEDYPRKTVGDCPFSKPMSSDLPIADVPLCVMNQTRFVKFSNVFKQ